MDATSLTCSICNKKPQFSDVSHLLTHISSKAHLASHFKLQVQSKHSSQALEHLTQYDQWYKENDIARLLSDRMASSAKANRRRRSNRPLVTETGKFSSLLIQYPPMSQRANSLADVPSQSSFGLPGDNIDPRLSDMQPLTDDHCKTRFSSLVNPYDPYEIFGPKVEPESPHLSEIDSIPWFGHHRGNNSATGHKYNPFVSTELLRAPTLKSENVPFSGSYLDLAEEKKVDEVSRLKGVQWPGMDCFDAASDVMKRQRNQKKDASTFKAMEEASCASEPSEWVFSPSGTLRKEREITGFVEEDDLLPGEWTVPKYRRDRRDRRGRGAQKPSTPRRRQGNQRVALAVTDVNRSVLGSRVTKKEHQPKRPVLRDLKRRESSIRTTSSKSENHGLSHGHFHRVHDENEDLKLSMGTTGRRHTSRLTIFRDDDSAEVEKKRNAPSPEMVPSSGTSNEQHNTLYQRASEAIHTLLDTNDSYKLPTLSNDSGPVLAHSGSHNRTSAQTNTSRNIDGIYLVDASGSNHRVPYDPLVGGNVLQYRWDWHGSELGRGSNDADDPLLGGGLFYNRAVSTDTTIYQDDQETKSCLWLDGYSR
ncbi:hypothetical protein ZTR_05809 [Talaromyces verruculosus]|nr:hypothetical protein ZTR_05809 [Talaromyces verruculosus]